MRKSDLHTLDVSHIGEKLLGPGPLGINSVDNLCVSRHMPHVCKSSFIIASHESDFDFRVKSPLEKSASSFIPLKASIQCTMSLRFKHHVQDTDRRMHL